MIIRNLTSEMKSLKVVDLTDSRELVIYIEGNSTTDLSGMYVADMNQLANTFEIVGCTHSVKSEDHPESVESNESEENSESLELEEISEDIEDSVDSEDNQLEEVDSEPTSLPNKFVCDVCGAEFASDRGLSSHKSRSHK